METDVADDESQHDRWMQRALDLADAAVRKGEVPVGAVFVVDGGVEIKFRASHAHVTASARWRGVFRPSTRRRRRDRVEVHEGPRNIPG